MYHIIIKMDDYLFNLEDHENLPQCPNVKQTLFGTTVAEDVTSAVVFMMKCDVVFKSLFPFRFRWLQRGVETS